MTTLQSWMTMPLAGALASTLVHSLWEGAAIAAILAIALVAARRASAQARYGMAVGAMAAMPVAFAVTLAVLIPDSAGVVVTSRLAGIPPVLTPLGFLPASQPVGTNWLLWTVPIWMAGVLVFYLRVLAGCWGVRRLRRSGVCPAAPQWQERVRELAARLRVTHPVLLMETCMSEVPVVIGYLRPVILIPAGLLAGLSPSQIEAILIHELAHIRRRDYLVNLLQRTVEGLLFYHPAVWWISSVIRAERENACDDMVVAVTGNPHHYAETLARLEEARWSAVPAATGGGLLRRVRRLLRQSEGPRLSAAPLFAAALLVVSVAIVGSAWQPKPAAPPDPPPPPAPQAQQDTVPPRPMRKTGAAPGQPVSTPYEKWLNEDVAYIVTLVERSRFRALSTDTQREEFIQDFWKRRDPTPGTDANEFKEEHYRRIAYANRRFSASDVPGWQTDRGRIYITYGPPDQLESHPTAAAGNAPYEEWLYKHIDGIGDRVIVRFVDAASNGLYRMMRDPGAGAAGARQPIVEVLPFDALPAGVVAQPPREGDLRYVMITVPVEGGRFNLSGNLTRAASGTNIGSFKGFEMSLSGDTVVRKAFPVPPGDWEVTLRLRPADGTGDVPEFRSFVHVQ